jgi:hypothetical protein
MSSSFDFAFGAAVVSFLAVVSGLVILSKSTYVLFDFVSFVGSGIDITISAISSYSPSFGFSSLEVVQLNHLRVLFSL